MVYDKTTWPRPNAILLASGYWSYGNFEPCMGCGALLGCGLRLVEQYSDLD
jgi:hypothetical protein